jgi:hypothetical protein
VKVNVTLPLLTTPKTCPATGWAAAATVGFKDGSSFVAPATAPCVTK